MKLSEAWLREWVDPPVSTEKLAEQLTMAGLEVDSIEPVAQNFTEAIIGIVLACNSHTEIRHLFHIKISLGDDKIYDIYHAQNCNLGTKIAYLPKKNNLEHIENIPVEKSFGSLCTYKSLFMACADENTLFELPNDAPTGTHLRDYLNLHDKILNLSITPNRGDCLSIQGIAREVGAQNKLILNKVALRPVNVDIADTIPITVASKVSEICPFYFARVIKGIDPTINTPLWLKKKLLCSGIRCTNSVIVDITNYVQIELGQPLHAFDFNKIDQEIIIRLAHPGEQITLLNKQIIKLRHDTLIVADIKHPIALAGIMGGQKAEIQKESSDILLESAHFSSSAIVGRARDYGITSEAAYRFERGVDPYLPEHALQRASNLILDICGGHAGPVMTHSNPQHSLQTGSIFLSQKQIEQVAGYVICEKQIEENLKIIGCQLKAIQGSSWEITPPTWRSDLNIAQDLIEEILRISNYNTIPTLPIYAELTKVEYPQPNLSSKLIAKLLIGRGYQEIMTYSFVDEAMQQLLHPQTKMLILPHPASKTMSSMRLSLWCGLLSTLIYNQNRQQNRVRLFEIGLCFFPDKDAEHGVSQQLAVAGCVAGPLYEEQWGLPTANSVDFFDIKGDLEELFKSIGIQNSISFKKDLNAPLHPGQSACIYQDGHYIGRLGVLHPQIQQKLDIEHKTILFELCLEKIKVEPLVKLKKISPFPVNRRDIAIIVKESIGSENIINFCKNIAKKELIHIKLFDVYNGDKVKIGYKSLGISLWLQNDEKTLDEKEITTIVSHIVTALQSQFQAHLRN